MLNSYTILITGSTDGIGKAAALKMASIGAKVIVHGRSESKVKDVLEEIKNRTKNSNIYGVVADFTSLEEVKNLADEITQKFSDLNVLVNNACIFSHRKIITKDGFEAGFQICHLAHFLLTLKLIDLLYKNFPSYIINVSSMVHASTIDLENLNSEKGYNGYDVYSMVKLLNILFTYKLNREIDTSKIKVYAVHPGVISTKLLHAGWGFGGASTSIGAENILSPILNDDLRKKTGIYIENQREHHSSSISYDKDIQDFVWEKSLEYVKKFL